MTPPPPSLAAARSSALVAATARCLLPPAPRFFLSSAEYSVVTRVAPCVASQSRLRGCSARLPYTAVTVLVVSSKMASSSQFAPQHLRAFEVETLALAEHEVGHVGIAQRLLIPLE